jgi:GNAT superfamily N-acetyltransferase
MKPCNEIDIKLLVDCQEYIPQLAILNYEQLGRFWNPEASVERAAQNLAKHSNRNQMPMTFVAVCDGKPIGMASLRENDGIRPGLIPWLGGLVVNPDYRGCGIGNRLLEAVKSQARLFGHNKIFLLAFDKTIPNWYAKLGWNDIGVDQLNGYPVVVMDIGL